MREGEHKTSLNCNEATRGRQTKLVVMVMNVCMSKPQRDTTKIYANVSFSERMSTNYMY
jgi:hypothetical protein